MHEDQQLISIRNRLKKAKEDFKFLISVHLNWKFRYSDIQSAGSVEKVTEIVEQIRKSGVQLPGNWSKLVQDTNAAKNVKDSRKAFNDWFHATKQERFEDISFDDINPDDQAMRNAYAKYVKLADEIFQYSQGNIQT